MIQIQTQKSRPGQAGNQNQTARDGTHGGVYPFRLDYSPERENCQPPGHLTPAERLLWQQAEDMRGNGDRQAYWDLRRAFLLEQSRRYRRE